MNTFYHIQAKQDLEDGLEIKLAVSSLVCTVAEGASAQRLAERMPEERRVGAIQRGQATANERDLRAEMNKIHSVVASMQTDFAAAKGELERAIGDMRIDLLTRMMEPKAIAEV